MYKLQCTSYHACTGVLSPGRAEVHTFWQRSVVVVDFIILLGESQQAVPFYWEP